MRSLIALAALPLLLTACGNGNDCGDVVTESYIHKYGIPVSKNEWNAKGSSGRVVSRLKDGVTLTQTYDRKVLHGESTYTFPYQDTIARVEEHEYGTLVRETFMYPTGNPEKEIIWKGKHLCSISTWYENGTPRSHEELDGQTLVDGRYLTRDNVMESEVKEMQGTRVRRDAYGQLLSRDEINNGLLTQRTTYHPNGTPQESIPYRQGKPHGLKRTFLASGEPHTIEQWMHGEQNGVTTFFSNGEKVSECEFVAGQREGIERKFEAGIQVVEEIAWHHDKRHGATRFFHPSGTHTDWYHDGKLVSKFVFDELSRRGHH